MKVLLRPDGGGAVGTGHVQRCRALVQALVRRGHQAHVVLPAGVAVLGPAIRTLGATVSPARFATGGDDADWLASLAVREGSEWVVLDGYSFGPRYELALQGAGRRILVVDDFAQSAHVCATIVLDQNLGSKRTDYEALGARDVLLGPRYAMLRDEFAPSKPRTLEPSVASRDISSASVRPSAAAPRVLVTFGGADPFGLTDMAVEAVKAAGAQAVAVLGPQAKDLPDTAGVTVVRNPPSMADLMSGCDVAIAAGGSTSWELCRMGVPALLVPSTRNQEGVVRELARVGIAEALPAPAGLTAPDLAARLASLLRNPDRLKSMADAGRALVDGHGARRVVVALEACDIQLVAARPEDARTLWDWANDPVTRSASFHPEAIGWGEHQAWLGRRLADPQCRLAIVQRENVAVGQVRLDCAGSEATISVSIAPGARGKGLAAPTIRAASIDYIRTASVQRIRALIRPTNEASLAAFSAAGYRLAGRTEANGVLAEEWEFEAS